MWLTAARAAFPTRQMPAAYFFCRSRVAASAGDLVGAMVIRSSFWKTMENSSVSFCGFGPFCLPASNGHRTRLRGAGTGVSGLRRLRPESENRAWRS